MMEPGPDAYDEILAAIEVGDTDAVWDIVGDGDLVDYI